jgi:putative ATPase
MAAVKKSLRENPVQAVPLWLRDAHTKTNKALGHGADYLYSHDYPQGVSGQEYMLNPEEFYQPGEAGAEAATARRMEELKKLKSEIRAREIP